MVGGGHQLDAHELFELPLHACHGYVQCSSRGDVGRGKLLPSAWVGGDFHVVGEEQERSLRLGGDLLGGDSLGGDLLGGDCLGGDRLGGVRLGYLLLTDLLVYLGDLTLTKCRKDLERDWRGLLPLLLRTWEGVCLAWNRGHACSRSIRRRFCSSINDVCCWTVRSRLLTRAPVGVASSGVFVGRVVISKTASARFYRSSKNRVSFRQGVMNLINF